MDLINQWHKVYSDYMRLSYSNKHQNEIDASWHKVTESLIELWEHYNSMEKNPFETFNKFFIYHIKRYELMNEMQKAF